LKCSKIQNLKNIFDSIYFFFIMAAAKFELSMLARQVLHHLNHVPNPQIQKFLWADLMSQLENFTPELM
jgi:hypothetical protein